MTADDLVKAQSIMNHGAEQILPEYSCLSTRSIKREQ